MDQNLQTSFIPKKPIVETRPVVSGSVGILSTISFLMLLAVILATGGLYFYNESLKKNIFQMESDLNLSKNRFEPSRILELQTLDKRIKASNEILSKHITVSPIFEELQSLTLPTVGFLKFNYDFDGNNVLVKLSGTASGYRAIALQSDLFAKNTNFKNPVFSNLLLGDKGNVTFDLEFSVEPSFVNYKNNLALAAEQKFSDVSTVPSSSDVLPPDSTLEAVDDFSDLNFEDLDF